MKGSKLPPKKDVALALLEHSSVFLHLDPRCNDVSVPPWFKKQPQLVLQVGLNLPVPIRNLDVGEDAISCTLSFNRSPHFCSIPWSAIYALVGEDGRGMVWPEDVPPEVAAQAQSSSSAADKPKRKRRPKLQAVRSAGDAEQPTQLRPRDRSARARGSEGAPLSEVPESAPAQAPSKSSAPPGDGSAPPSKRQLPPYLRVVK